MSAIPQGPAPHEGHDRPAESGEAARGLRTRLQAARGTRLQAARVPGLLVAGAGLLMCAPVFPGLSRLVLLPALLLAPGYALLRLLGQAAGKRAVSVAIPVSLVLVVCSSLVLDVSGIRLSPISLGLLLGAVTVVFVASSYGGQLVSRRRAQRRGSQVGDRDLVRHDAYRG